MSHFGGVSEHSHDEKYYFKSSGRAFHGKRKNLTLEGGFETRRSRLQLIAQLPDGRDLDQTIESKAYPKLKQTKNSRLPLAWYCALHFSMEATFALRLFNADDYYPISPCSL